MKANPSAELIWQIQYVAKNRIPTPRTEYRFHETRMWRADLCWPNDWPRLIVEIEGGAWIQGRHTRGAGFVGDMEKYNEAAIMGYRLLRFTPKQVKTGEALQVLERFFLGEKR